MFEFNFCRMLCGKRWKEKGKHKWCNFKSVRTYHCYIYSMEDILNGLKKAVKEDNPLRIMVRRTAVWADALHEATKKRFDSTSLLKITVILHAVIS